MLSRPWLFLDGLIDEYITAGSAGNGAPNKDDVVFFVRLDDLKI